MPRIFGLLAILLLSCAWSFSQPAAYPQASDKAAADAAPQNLSKLSRQVDLVLVPVVVTDKSGQHVAGIKKEAFRIEENGKPQNVSVFEEIAAEKPAASNAKGDYSNYVLAGEGAWRMTIVVLDMVNTPWLRQIEAKEQLRSYLLRSISRDESMALLGLTGAGLRQLHPFTRNTQALVEALQKLKLSSSSEEGTQPNPNTADDGTPDLQGSEDLQIMSAFMKDLDTTITATYERQAIHLTLHGLTQIARAFAGIPGRKTLIWATAGLPFMIDDPQMFARMGDDMYAEYEHAWKALGSANIAVYPVDLSTLESNSASLPSSTYGQSTSANSIANMRGINGMKSAMQIPYYKEVQQQLTLRAFADATGGRACVTINELEKCFATAIEDSRSYYLLGYYLPSDAKAGWRKLRVKVTGGDLQVRNRQGFYVVPKTGEPPDLKRSELVEAPASPIDYTGVRLNVRRVQLSVKPPAEGAEAGTNASANANAAGKTPVEIMLAISGGSITIDQKKSDAVDLQIAAVAFDKSGTSVTSISQSVATRLDAELAKKVLATNLGLKEFVALPPGAYEVKFAVRDNPSGQLGTVSIPLTVTSETAK